MARKAASGMPWRPALVPYKDAGIYYDDGELDIICTENRGDDD